jgi:hypothetical protein
MPTIPDAAIAVIAAALDDYRLTTPIGQQNPRGAAERAAEYLLSSGWGLHVPTTYPPPPPSSRPRAACPACRIRCLITLAGRIRRHGPPSHPCPGSGTPARQQTAPA